MYYCKSRFYVPKWRRWLNSDSIDYLEHQNITCLNLFAYCNNNPVMYVNPTGDFAISILVLLIGAGVCALATIAADYIMNNKCEIWDYGPGNDRNVIKKWLDRIIRALLGR